jgi:hypothetical protein
MIYRRAYLRELCGDAYARPTIASPFSTKHDGKRWDVATNGQCMVLVGGEPAWPAREDAPVIARALPKEYGAPQSVDLARLRDWCASTPGCEDCDATGWREADDSEDVIACPVCERGYKRGYSTLLGRYVQRALLWRYLRPLSQPESVLVHFAGEKCAAFIQHPADEWRVYCMPCVRHSGDTIEDPFE